MQPQPILHFWFTELTPKQHFAKVAALDEAIRTRFGATPEGRLTEVLVLDQFSRNMYRDTPRPFTQNALA